jgi:Xaa-Pro aminopeptidase
MPDLRSLPPIDHAAHRHAVRSRLAAAELDVLLVTDPANVRYLTGFAGSNGQVLLGRQATDDRLVTDHRYEERARTEARGLEVVLSRDPLAVAVQHAAGRDSNGTLGVEADHLSWQQAERLRALAEDARRSPVATLAVRPTTGLVEEGRVVKDAAELARLAEACRLTVDALSWLLTEVARAGRTERELAIALERRFVDLGADGVAFPSIVAAGPNGAVPHHAPTDRPLARGELLTVDCGAVVDGYHADCTRTIALGDPPDELAAVHEVVRQAQATGRAAAVAGATGADVDAAARGVIAAAGFGERFVHGTGHGLGLRVHEAPTVGQGGHATLAAGTALTVEPGIYLPGVGGVRIEDTIVVTADGPAHILTDLSRELRP